MRTHNVAVGSLPPRRGARQRARATHPPRELPKTQTTSVKMGEFGVLCSRWSAFWAPRHLKQRPRHHQTGGIAPSKAPTRRRHAVRAPLMLQTPIAASTKYAASPTSPGNSTGWREKIRPARPLQWLFREKVRPACVKTPNLGQFERTGRIFSRFHDLTATQGEFFRACRRRPSSALPISDQVPRVWRASADPESPAAVPVSSARTLP